MSEPTKFYLFKRANGYYYILYVEDGRKRWKSTGAEKKAEALKALSSFRDLIKKTPQSVPLPRFVQDFLSFARTNYAPATVDIYYRALTRLIDLIPGASVNALTPQHLDRYKSLRVGEVSPVSVNIELRSLRSAMNVAVRWKLVEANPFSRMQQVRVAETQPAYLTKEDFQKLIDLVKEVWLKEVIVFAALTGMRRGEILNLRWDAIDLQRKVIRVESHSDFKTKQGRRRVVPMSDVVHNLLASKWAQSTTDRVFTLRDRPIMDDWVSKRFKQYVSLAKLKDARLHFHSLRHTFASWLVQDGVSLYEVQKLLGHASISVTQVYSHLRPDQLHETVNRITLN